MVACVCELLELSLLDERHVISHQDMVRYWEGGGGGGGENQWFQVQWCEWPGFAEASIAAKELLPIKTVTMVWGPRWVGTSVLCHCHNTAAVAAVRGGYCKDLTLAHMLRCLFFVEARCDLSLTAAHIPGKENRVADDISRNNLASFFCSCPTGTLRAIPGAKGPGGAAGYKQALNIRRLEELARDLVEGTLAPSTKRVYKSGQ